MTGYEFGDVLLVPFPFTDQTGAKQRPAVVVNSRRYRHERPDLILMPITSQTPSSTRFGDVPIADIGAAGLLMPASSSRSCSPWKPSSSASRSAVWQTTINAHCATASHC
jgi:hypothetical protein